MEGLGVGKARCQGQQPNGCENHQQGQKRRGDGNQQEFQLTPPAGEGTATANGATPD